MEKVTLTVKNSDWIQAVLAFRQKKKKRFVEKNTMSPHKSNSEYGLDPNWFVTISGLEVETYSHFANAWMSFGYYQLLNNMETNPS